MTNSSGWAVEWVTKFEFEDHIEDYIESRTGLEFVGIVPWRERREMMLKHGDMLGATEDERLRFIRADALARVVDGEGRATFLAVEVSYIVHWRNTSRAIRNASFLTRMTGVPAHAAVAGVRVNKRSQAAVDSGEALFIKIKDFAPSEDEEDEE